MKRIRRMDTPTPGLRQYLADDGDRQDWRRFRDYDGGLAYRNLRDRLVELQHGLCGYCEVRLVVGLDSQIEHVTPRNNPTHGAANTFNPANLISCCEGGTRVQVYGPGLANADPVRVLPPVVNNTSCGARKGDRTIADFIDPRDVPTYPSLFRVMLNGEITPNAGGCAQADIPVGRVENTIAFLGLNVPRLRRAREQYFIALEEEESGYLNNAGAIQSEARRALLPGDDCYLPNFFTTARSYFGQLGERVLADQPQAWI